MSLPQSSRCCRAFSNPRLRPQCRDTVRLAESALKATPPQKVLVSKRVIARHGSNVPGPMESRKRLGKRHMGALNLDQFQASAPLWQLGDMMDLTKWKWAPPTARDQPKQQQEEQIQTPTIEQLWSAVFNVANEQPVSVAQDLDLTMSNIQNDPTAVMELALSCLIEDAPAIEERRVRPTFTRFCSSLQNYLACNYFPAQSLRAVLLGITRNIMSLTPDLKNQTTESLPRLFGSLKVQLYGAVIDGLLSFAQRDPSMLFDSGLWSMLLHDLSKLEIECIPLFRQIMAHTPDDEIGNIGSGIIAQLETMFIALGRQGIARNTVRRKVSKIAWCLSRLSSVDHVQMLDVATRRLAVLIRNKETQLQEARFCWLLLLSRLPKVGLDYLTHTCCLLEEGLDVPPLTPKEVCKIFLGWLTRYHWVEASEGRHLRLEITSKEVFLGDLDPMCYGALGRSFWVKGQRLHVRELCDFLVRLGRAQDISHVMEGVKGVVRNGAVELASLVAGVGDIQMAMRMLLGHDDDKKAPKNFWATDTADRTLRILTHFKTLRTDRLLPKLRIFAPGRRDRIKPRMRIRFIKGEMPCISNRTMRHVRRHRRKMYLRTKGRTIHPRTDGITRRVRRHPRKIYLRTNGRIIRLRYEGKKRIRITSDGRKIRIRTNGRTIRLKSEGKSMVHITSTDRRVRIRANGRLIHIKTVYQLPLVQKKKVEKAAMLLARAPHIPNRLALDQVSQCVGFFQDRKMAVPRNVLRALLHVITRDLASGRPGRRERFRWFIQLYAREVGDEKAKELARQLMEWRNRNEERWKMRMSAARLR